MASKQEPPPILGSEPPARSSSQYDDLSPAPPTPARSASLITSIMRSTTSTSLLRTPSLEAPSPSRGRTRNDANGEGSAQSPFSISRATLTMSPSGIRSTTLSPSISSGGGSLYSSDTGRSPWSLSSSGYLTPPQFQADCDRKPYKARRQNSDSLNMMRKPKEASTVPQVKMHKPRRRHRRRKRRCHQSRCHEDSGFWRQQACHLAPTAPTGMKELCIGHIGRHKPRGENTNTYERILPRLWSDPAPPLISRRWTSVEIGSHQIHLASTLPPRSIVSTHTGEQSDKNDDNFLLRRPSRPYRSSTFTRGAIDHDIVRTVREQLTIRKMPLLDLRTPTTITLRRASGASAKSGVSTMADLLTPTNGDVTGSTTPRPYPKSQADADTDTAYLITSKEIDSITELIEANLRQNFRPHSRVNAHTPVTNPSARGAQSPTLSLTGLLPQKSYPTLWAATSTQVSLQAQAAPSLIQDSSSYLQVTAPTWTRTRSDSKSPSQKSNEVIWKAGGSPNSPSSMEDSDRRRSSTSDSSPTNHTPRSHDSKLPRLLPPSQDKGDAFDRNNAKASISEWSWRLRQPKIPTIVTSSDSESNDFTADSVPPSKASPQTLRTPIRSVASAPDIPKAPTKAKRRISARPALTSPEVEDVVFFPPLPTRKTTNEWFSPLPDIGSPPPKSPSPKSLYDEGIDATGALPASLAAPKAQKNPQFSMMDRPVSPTPSIEFDPDYDIRCQSVVKAHPQAPARVGFPDSMGSSIGASSGKRRKSSIKSGTKRRVHTIDNANRPSRAGTWTRNRPPSVCPPAIAASPAEVSNNESSRPTSPPPIKRIGRVDIDSIRHEISPPLPKMDRAGIFTKITGTVRSTLGLDDCEEDCPPKHECGDCARDLQSRPSVDWIG